MNTADWSRYATVVWQVQSPDAAQALPVNRIDCWHFDLANGETAFADRPALLTADDQARIATLTGARAAAFRRHRQCVRQVLSLYPNQADRCILTDSQGKPYLDGDASLHFSLSHSGHHLVMALSDQPLGADIEAQDRALSATSQQQIAARLHWQEDASNAPFIARWTRFEAQQKCAGLGIFGAGQTTPFLTTLLTPEGQCLSLAAEHKQTPELRWLQLAW